MLDLGAPCKAQPQAQTRALGLWTLRLLSLREGPPGTRLDNADWALLAEIMGRTPWAAEIVNCSAPDSGTTELLQIVATPAQTDGWFNPLQRGEMRSFLAVSKPYTASSDPATNPPRREPAQTCPPSDADRANGQTRPHGAGFALAQARLGAGPGARSGARHDAQRRPVCAGAGVDVRTCAGAPGL